MLVGIQQKPRFLAFPASPCARTPSGRSRSLREPISWQDGTWSGCKWRQRKSTERVEQWQACQPATTAGCFCGTVTRPSAWQRSSCAVSASEKRRAELQLGAGVRIDFAVQANFFKRWCCPFHDFPQSAVQRADRTLAVSIADRLSEIN